MTFRSDAIEAFQATFDRSRPKILEFEGCSDVQLLQDENHPNIMMTYSVWTNEEALNAYRHSAFFQNTWKHTKTLFSDKPEAWSLDQIR